MRTHRLPVPVPNWQSETHDSLNFLPFERCEIFQLPGEKKKNSRNVTANVLRLSFCSRCFFREKKRGRDPGGSGTTYIVTFSLLNILNYRSLKRKFRPARTRFSGRPSFFKRRMHFFLFFSSLNSQKGYPNRVIIALRVFARSQEILNARNARDVGFIRKKKKKAHKYLK